MLSERSPVKNKYMYDNTYMWNLKKIKLVETDSRMVVTRA